eukprot:5727172-Lingulodinium_polyedra.AAC.1
MRATLPATRAAATSSRAEHMRRLAIATCSWPATVSSGRPHGASADRSGGGPPGTRRATDRVSQGGEAMTPATAPL